MNDVIRLLSESYAQIGDGFSYLGEHDLAFLYHGKSLALEKNNPKRQLAYAIQYTRQGDYELAEALFESAFSNNSFLENASFYRKAYAELLFQKKAYDRAVVQYNAAMAMATRPQDVNEIMLGMIITRSYAKQAPVFPSKTELDNLNLSIWPGPVIAYLSGKRSEKNLLNVIKNSDDEEAQKRLTVVLYYLGKLNQLSHEDSFAKACFRSVLTLKNNQMNETFLAKQALQNVTALP